MDELLVPEKLQELRDELDDLSALAIRLANAVEFVAGLDRPLTAGAPSGTNERAALATLAADARRAGLLPQGSCDCESYEPCHGECCGPGWCSCSTPPAGAPVSDADLISLQDQINIMVSRQDQIGLKTGEGGQDG